MVRQINQMSVRLMMKLGAVALLAAAVLLPVIETAVGLVAPGAARKFAAAPMSADDARAILRNATVLLHAA